MSPIVYDEHGKPRGFACVRRSYVRPPCSFCNGVREADKLCDFPVERDGRKATCDKPCCWKCAKHVAFDTDHCPDHVQEAVRAGR